MPAKKFPQKFVWGVATSAFQIEGSTTSDGRGESIWDRFSGAPGKIEDGSDARTACDHYRLWSEDVDLIKQLGVDSYRFSIAWPRIFPEGSGAVNRAGLSFYDRLVDRLLSQGIKPFVTLYHWDLPQVLQDRGGWADRDTAKRFGDFAHTMGRRLGDRVKHWVTHNEPWCVSVLGNEGGQHAPGNTDRRLALAVGHHVLLSHGIAVGALRECADDLEVGIAHILSPGHPASSSEADARATQHFDQDFNRWFVEPAALGKYPPEAVERFRHEKLIDERHPVLSNPDDLKIISTPTDFLGINYYSRAIIRAGVPESENSPRELFTPPPEQLTDMGWEVYPTGLYEVLQRAATEWNAKKIYVTECGAAYDDGPDEDGRIADSRRISFLEGHFAEARRAIADGVPLAGLFVWSLFDNFEWAFGYSKRFGVVWVDFQTQQRSLKDSALWFQRFLESEGRR